jgi:hypothetical protein
MATHRDRIEALEREVAGLRQVVAPTAAMLQLMYEAGHSDGRQSITGRGRPGSVGSGCPDLASFPGSAARRWGQYAAAGGRTAAAGDPGSRARAGTRARA